MGIKKCANDLVKNTEFLMCIRIFIYVYFKMALFTRECESHNYLLVLIYYKLMW